MKKILVLLVFLSTAVFINAANKNIISIGFSATTVKVQISANRITYPRFTWGNHGDDLSLIFSKVSDDYQADMPKFKRGFGSGLIGDGAIIIYQISSGPVPKDLSAPLTVRVNIPAGKSLIYHGRVWEKGIAEVEFKNYFTAREFPIILINNNQYIQRSVRLNRLDSFHAVIAWVDSLSKSQVPAAAQVIDSAASKVGQLWPGYFHHHILLYDGVRYLLVYIISRDVVTGLEHFNAPFIVTVPNFITLDGAVHTMLHSSIGKGAGPAEYSEADGKFHPSDALGFYEGLTVYLSMRYVRHDFAANLSAQLYRAKLLASCNDLSKMSTCGSSIEKWYGAGYAYLIYLQSQGLNVQLFAQFLYTLELRNKPFPLTMHWSDLLHWLAVYDPRIGKIAADSYKGKYLAVFDTLRAKGWKPIPVYQVPRWYDLYIGPYALTPGGVQLPTDNYPATSAHPKFLLNTDGSKVALAPKMDNPGLMFIKAHPDSSFRIEFSDGSIKTVPNKLKFADGSDYSMHSVIDYSVAPDFWSKLNFYWPVDKQKGATKK